MLVFVWKDKDPCRSNARQRWTRQRRSNQDAIGTNKKESFSAGAPWNVFGTTIGKKDFSRCHRQNTLPSEQSPKLHWQECKESHRGMPTLLSVAWQSLQKHKNVSTIMTDKDWIDIIRRVNSSWPPRVSWRMHQPEKNGVIIQKLPSAGQLFCWSAQYITVYWRCAILRTTYFYKIVILNYAQQ